MASFIGSGTFTVQGSSSRIHDCQFGSSNMLEITGERCELRNVIVSGTLTVSANYVHLSDSSIRTTTWSGHSGSISDSLVIVGAIAVSGNRTRILGNIFSSAAGLDITADKCVVSGNVFYRTTAGNDSVSVDGDRNLVQDNMFDPLVASTNSAVNIVGGECNMVWGNDLGDPDDYVIDALIDAGANTQLFYPNDATYGDNLTNCGTGS